MESSVKQLLREYRSFHTEKRNKIAHNIGIPAVMLGLLIALSWVSVSIAGKWHISFAWIAVIGLLIYYFFLDVKLASAMAVVMVIITSFCTWIAFPAPTRATLILFLLLTLGGSLLCFIGHHFEQKRINITAHARFGFIGPLNLLVELINRFGWKKYFNSKTSAGSDRDFS